MFIIMNYVCSTMENFKKLAGERDVVLFGAGEGCMRFLNRMDSSSLQSVKYILTNKRRKIGGALYGIPIASPDLLQSLDARKTLAVITAKRAVVEIYKQITQISSCPIMVSEILTHPVFAALTEDLYIHQEELRQVSDILYDDISRKVYSEAIRRRMLYGTCDFSDLMVKNDIEYCPAFWFADSRPENEIILDCGAYNGDTLKKFTRIYGPKLKKIYLFECMPQSLKALEEIKFRLANQAYTPEITIMPYALSNQEGKTAFASMDADPTASFVLESRSLAKTDLYNREEIQVSVSTIDRLVPKEERVTQIKMDIEGSEYNALLGARETILRCKPKLAISLYHNGEHYYRLPLLVKEMVPEYKIAIRHHHRNHVDTDMYCWI